METRVALIGIIVENSDSVEKMNALLHEYGSWIIGRMGVPYRQKGISHHQRRDRRAHGQDQQPLRKAWNA